MSSVTEKPVWREWIESLLIIAVLAITIRSFVVAPFKIPSTSMVPTLEIGDYLFVLRYPYGFRIPLTDIQILSKEANRGDVVTYRDNKLSVNGKEMPLVEKGKRAYYMADGTADVSGVFEENLSGVKHQVLRKEYSIRDGEWTVPAGHYFAVGDNRNNSRDSRFWGFVPQSYMVGRAAIIWWSWDGFKNEVRWDRLGLVLE